MFTLVQILGREVDAISAKACFMTSNAEALKAIWNFSKKKEESVIESSSSPSRAAEGVRGTGHVSLIK